MLELGDVFFFLDLQVFSKSGNVRAGALVLSHTSVFAYRSAAVSEFLFCKLVVASMRDFTLFLTTCFSQAVQNENLQFRRRGVNKLKGHDFAMTKSALGPIQDFRHFFLLVF